MKTAVTTNYSNLVFDLGAVLIDWNPRYLYNKIFATAAETDFFLTNICTSDWNEEQDAGRSLQDGTELLITQHPQYEAQIRAFYGRWKEMLGGPIEETVEILRDLKDSKQYKLYALTNWSNETFPLALLNYPFLQWFDGIVVSGREKIRKPDAAFYNLLLNRYELDAAATLFIDDNERNIRGAAACGIDGIHFQSAGQLRRELEEQAILPAVVHS
ncbi:HAD family hydrolase [Chitinophaga rhizophila]|uniref:HAD family phosphatase n=1 Tax=Chitinophaga rhizophila TaxID=2866212 RepID=A0ABS7G7X6_9BACT|nr:HAD family phosphatase [Chitinophaga rhizophila]MBW8683767.1 HAD family phosphatase [Chitinophaga rhizophila]